MLNHLHILFTTEAGVTLGCAVQFVKGAFSRRAGKRLEMDASKGEALQMRFDSCSLSFWNETRHTGIHHWIQPLSGLDSINLVQRVCRKGPDVEVLARARRTPGRGKQSRSALHRPSQQNLRRSLSQRSTAKNNRSQAARASFRDPVAQKPKAPRPSPCRIPIAPFRQIRMRFHLHHGWLDSRRFVNGLHFVQTDVRSPIAGICRRPRDSPSPARYREKSPRGRKRHCLLIPAILASPGLKRERSVNEIKIQIVEPQTFQTRLESRLNALRPVIRVPHLCGNKNVPTRSPPSREPCLQSLAHLALIPISFRTIGVWNSRVQRVSSRGDRQSSIGINVPKPTPAYSRPRR